MNKIVLLGAPGAGKGTISELLIKNQKLVHISVGDILRQNIKDNTDLGKLANKYMLAGNLLPDDIIIKLVEHRLSCKDCKNNFLLDGYPRTIKQAEALDKFNKPTYVFNLKVDINVVIERLTGRRICNKCNSIFHVKNLKNEICPSCDCKLNKRDDDKYEVVKNRIDVYFKETAPLIDYYKNNKQLIEINALGNPNDVYSQIEKFLK